MFLDGKELAQTLNVSPRVIRTWTTAGVIPYVRIRRKGKRRYVLNEVLDALEKHKRYAGDKVVVDDPHKRFVRDIVARVVSKSQASR